MLESQMDKSMLHLPISIGSNTPSRTQQLGLIILLAALVVYVLIGTQ